MKTYYTLEVEVWNDSLEAREEAQKILNQEPISKENLLLAKYKKSVVAFLQSPQLLVYFNGLQNLLQLF